MAHHGTFAGNDWQVSSVQGMYIVLTYAEFFPDISSDSVEE
jgi:hypothetical protein